MRAYERLLNYVKIHTASSDESESVPTTERQKDLGRILVQELLDMGVSNAHMDEFGYVYASIPATSGCESAPSMGFIAHVDTIPDFCGENVKPRLVENYDGGEIVLGESGRTISPKVFPHLTKLAGRTLIVTDGTTLLGADDKAGVAEIMTLAEKLLTSDIPHGKICIGFTPDEEVGKGASHFNIPEFGADFAYTVDGDLEGEVVYENFNAASAAITIHGFNVHPGSAKDKMINASLVAMELNAMLPSGDTPRDTENYEGFFHLCEITGNVETCKMYYIIRDHNPERFEGRKETLMHVIKLLNEKYGSGTVVMQMRDQYRNMCELIKPCFHLIDNAVAVIRELGLEPVIEPIRGGTDGATLSYMGLPCPNLGTGGSAFHGPYEHVSIEGMDYCVDILLGIVEKYAAKA
ncbi:MAG TPA: peptidase T [Clostridia bacterium]|nr:peptidase T [Clostridia bacterium]